MSASLFNRYMRNFVSSMRLRCPRAVVLIGSLVAMSCSAPQESIEATAAALWRTGDFVSAARATQDLWNRSPNSLPTTLFICDFWSALEDRDRTEQWCEHAERLAGDTAFALYAKIGRAHAQNDLQGLATITGADLITLKGTGILFPASRVLRDARIRGRDYTGAREIYETLFPELADNQIKVSSENARAAVDYALLMVNAGRFDKAKLLLDQAEEIFVQGEQRGEAGFALAEIAAIRGRNEVSINELQQLIDAKVRWQWWYLEKSENLVTLHDDNRFVIMLNILRADLQRQRRHIIEEGLLLEPDQLAAAGN